MFARGQGSSGVTEEVVEDKFGFEMCISKAFELDVGYLEVAGFVDIFFELFEFVLGAEKLSASDV